HRPARDEEARGTRRYRSRRAALGGERPRGPVSADAWVTALTLAAAGATGAGAGILTRTGTKIGLPAPARLPPGSEGAGGHRQPESPRDVGCAFDTVAIR